MPRDDSVVLAEGPHKVQRLLHVVESAVGSSSAPEFHEESKGFNEFYSAVHTFYTSMVGKRRVEPLLSQLTKAVEDPALSPAAVRQYLREESMWSSTVSSAVASWEQSYDAFADVLIPVVVAVREIQFGIRLCAVAGASRLTVAKAAEQRRQYGSGALTTDATADQRSYTGAVVAAHLQQGIVEGLLQQHTLHRPTSALLESAVTTIQRLKEAERIAEEKRREAEAWFTMKGKRVEPSTNACFFDSHRFCTGKAQEHEVKSDEQREQEGIAALFSENSALLDTLRGSAAADGAAATGTAVASAFAALPSDIASHIDTAGSLRKASEADLLSMVDGFIRVHTQRIAPSHACLLRLGNEGEHTFALLPMSVISPEGGATKRRMKGRKRRTAASSGEGHVLRFESVTASDVALSSLYAARVQLHSLSAREEQRHRHGIALSHLLACNAMLAAANSKLQPAGAVMPWWYTPSSIDTAAASASEMVRLPLPAGVFWGALDRAGRKKTRTVSRMGLEHLFTDQALAVTLSVGTVKSSAGTEGVMEEDAVFDFHRDPNPRELCLCLPILASKLHNVLLLLKVRQRCCCASQCLFHHHRWWL